MSDVQLDLFSTEGVLTTPSGKDALAAPSREGIFKGSGDTVLVIDSMALLYRGFHALKGISNSKGKPTGGLYNFFSTCLKLFESVQPTHCFAAFEAGVPTKRKEAYPDYKAQRKPTPVELLEQIPQCEQLCTNMGLAVLKAPGYEADDLIAAVAACASDKQDVRIASGDRDLFQLLSPSVSILQPASERNGGFVHMTVESFTAKYNLQPHQWVERRALEGDASDNLPGVAGIGEKTASDLIGRFGSLENVYEHLDEVAPKVRTRLETGRESAFFTRSMALLQPDCQVIDLASGLLHDGDEAALLAQLEELEFRALARTWARWRATLRSR